jgi:hypothetical protein
VLLIEVVLTLNFLIGLGLTLDGQVITGDADVYLLGLYPG